MKNINNPMSQLCQAQKKDKTNKNTLKKLIYDLLTEHDARFTVFIESLTVEL